jgi:pyridoxine 5-phosphate synthase
MKQQLNVNIDHIATLRQARLGIEPDPIFGVAIVELAGAHGITAHLREDRRHMQDRDIRLIKEVTKTKLNLEMAATEEMINIALQTKPAWCTLVPEKRQELTTEGGLNAAGLKASLDGVVKRLQEGGILVSLFIDPDPVQVDAAHTLGADFIELHTGRYAEAFGTDNEDKEFLQIKRSAEQARDLGLRVNAGHGLNYLNMRKMVELDTIEEFSIGHSIIARAVFTGLDQAVREMLALLK